MSLQPLPREGALQEIHKYKTDGLQVISATLLFTQVCVDTGISRCAGQGFVLPEGNVISCPRITIPLGKTVINHVKGVLLFPNTDQEIIGLHVTMNERIGVQVLYPGEHLVSDHQNCFECELSVAVSEQVLKRGPQQLHHHGIVVSLHAEPDDRGDTIYRC